MRNLLWFKPLHCLGRQACKPPHCTDACDSFLKHPNIKNVARLHSRFLNALRGLLELSRIVKTLIFLFLLICSIHSWASLEVIFNLVSSLILTLDLGLCRYNGSTLSIVTLPAKCCITDKKLSMNPSPATIRSFTCICCLLTFLTRTS